MSLAARIIFVTSMLLCAALCTWAALAFGGPGETAMWVLAGLCVVVSVVVLLIKGPGTERLQSSRVEGAREPTFRLVGSEMGAHGKTWQLVLGDSQCTLIRPDGTPATTFPRKWVEIAIRSPGFVSGSLLGIVTEDWSPPDNERRMTPGELLRAARSIRRQDDRDTPYYWFSAPEDLIHAIEDYRRRTLVELGAEAAGPLLIKARRCILSGVIGMTAGIGILLFGIASLMGQGGGAADRGARTVGLGVAISLIGLWRLGRGIALQRQAWRVSRAGGPSLPSG
jgi:hypothetical protein